MYKLHIHFLVQNSITQNTLPATSVFQVHDKSPWFPSQAIDCRRCSVNYSISLANYIWHIVDREDKQELSKLAAELKGQIEL